MRPHLAIFVHGAENEVPAGISVTLSDLCTRSELRHRLHVEGARHVAQRWLGLVEGASLAALLEAQNRVDEGSHLLRCEPHSQPDQRFLQFGCLNLAVHLGILLQWC